MQKAMLQTTADRQNRSRAAARLLLSLLLMIAPLLAAAGVAPVTLAAGDGGNSPASAPMPCHTLEAQTTRSAETAQQDACPHCTGDAPASQCHCCGYAAPAGLGFHTDMLSDTRADGLPLRLAATHPLPDSPGDCLYRPPIALS